MSTSTKPQISLWLALPLSTIMIAFSIAAHFDDPFDTPPDAPVFTTIRDPKSSLPLLHQRRLDVEPLWLYTHFKGTASIVWSILLPLQHIPSLRKTYPTFHRLSGYTLVLLSLILGVTGYILIVKNWTTTHPDLFHLHSFPEEYGLISRAVKWPTFALGIWGLAPPYFFSLGMLLTRARERRFEEHRWWAVLFSICGYAIAVERVWVLAIMGMGKGLAWLEGGVVGEWIREEVLKVPEQHKEVVMAEVAGFAGTLVLAGVVVLGWGVWELGGKNSGRERVRVMGKKKKRV